MYIHWRIFFQEHLREHPNHDWTDMVEIAEEKLHTFKTDTSYEQLSAHFYRFDAAWTIMNWGQQYMLVFDNEDDMITLRLLI